MGKASPYPRAGTMNLPQILPDGAERSQRGPEPTDGHLASCIHGVYATLPALQLKASAWRFGRFPLYRLGGEKPSRDYAAG